MSGLNKGSSPSLTLRSNQRMNSPSTIRPAPTTNGASERPNGVIGELALVIQPHSLARRIPNTRRPRPRADSTEPTQSSFGTGLGRAMSVINRTERTIKSVRITSPTKTYRQV